MELDPDQLCPYKQASKKPKGKAGASSASEKGKVTSLPKKSTSSGAAKRKKAASSWKKHASPTPAVVPDLPTTEGVEEEEEASPEPLKRR